MSATSPAHFCDGETLRSHVVEATCDAEELHVRGEGVERYASVPSLTVTSPLGRTPRFIRFPDGALLEVAADSALAGELDAGHMRPSSLARLVHWLESRTAVAASATVGVCVLVVLTIWLGLPALARRAALAASPTIERQAGRTGLAFFNQRFARSELTPADERRVRRQLTRLLRVQPTHVRPELHFFHFGFANAFALPGGYIIISDELVRIAANDEEIAAVLAHELGHVELRHGLQSVLRNSAALIVVSTVTGDLSTLTAFSGTLPFLLFQRGYDRAFEREADAFAVTLLRRARINPANLAYMLERLENARPKTGNDFTYLSTHPSTADRVKQLRAEPGPW